MPLFEVAQHAHTAGKAILVPCLTGIGPLLLAVGGLAAFIGYRKDDNTYHAELIASGKMKAPAASAAVADRRKRLMTCCLVGFIAGVIVSLLAILGSLDLL